MFAVHSCENSPVIFIFKPLLILFFLGVVAVTRTYPVLKLHSLILHTENSRLSFECNQHFSVAPAFTRGQKVIQLSGWKISSELLCNDCSDSNQQFSPACDCGADQQTANRIITECPLYHPPNGLRGLIDVDADAATSEWLISKFPKILLFFWL